MRLEEIFPALREGKKAARADWLTGHKTPMHFRYIFLRDGEGQVADPAVRLHDGRTMNFHINGHQIEADDWQIYED